MGSAKAAPRDAAAHRVPQFQLLDLLPVAVYVCDASVGAGFQKKTASFEALEVMV
jgi:hypothetical protein